MNKFDVTVAHHGMKIHAIKLIRAVFGFGLKEAKDVVEMFGTSHDIPHFVLRMTGDQVAVLTQHLLEQPEPCGIGSKKIEISSVKLANASFFDVSGMVMSSLIRF